MTRTAETLAFFVPCVPPTVNHQRKQIVRFRSRRTGRLTRGLADRPQLVLAKMELRRLLLPFRPAMPVPAPVRLEITWVWPWPSRTTKTARAAGRAWHESKPDTSNVLKTLEDQLVALGFLDDDAGIAAHNLRKCWGTETGLWIRLSTLTEPPA